MSGFNPSIQGAGFSNSNFFRQIDQFQQKNPDQRVTINNIADQQIEQSGGAQDNDTTEDSSDAGLGAQDKGPRGRTVETGRTEDIRTENDTFIALGSGDDQRFARSASLEVTENGNVQDSVTGRQLQQTTQNEDGETTTEDLELSEEEQTLDAQATSEADIGGNLSRLTDEGESVEFEGEFTNSEAGTETVSFQATRTGENEFEITAEDPENGNNALTASVSFNEGGEVEETNVQENDSGFEGLSFSSESGDQVEVKSGNLNFEGLSLDFGENTARVTRENGSSSGELKNLTVNENGRLQGNFSNGETQDLGEIATAEFEDSSQLTEFNDGTFAANRSSEEPDFSGNTQLTTGELETQNSNNTQNVIDDFLAETSENDPRRGELLGAALDISA